MAKSIITKKESAKRVAINSDDQPKKELHHLEYEYTEELADMICDVIGDTPKGLEDICEENPWMPKKTTIYKWLKLHRTFAEKYARAKQKQVHEHAEEIIVIADNCAPVKDHVEKAKLQVDARKWFTSKLLPKVYGDRPELFISKEDESAKTTKESLADKISKIAGLISNKKKISGEAEK